MNEKLKTLKELADEHGFPFDVKYKNEAYPGIHTCVAISKSNRAAVFDKDGNVDDWPALDKNWTLAPKKKVVKSFLYESYNGEYGMGYAEIPQVWCKMHECKVIKILEDIEV